MVRGNEEEFQELEEEGKDEVEVEKEEDEEAHAAEEEPEGLRPLVLDATFFLLGWRPGDLPTAAPLFTVPRVVEEVRSREGRYRLSALPTLSILSPSRASLAAVEKAVSDTGDSLSRADKEVVALALDLGGEVVSDDYSIQNVCRHLGIPFRPLFTGGIKKKFRWGYRCTSCGRIYFHDPGRCPRCGGALKRVRLR